MIATIKIIAAIPMTKTKFNLFTLLELEIAAGTDGRPGGATDGDIAETGAVEKTKSD